jgi:tetratricopeptide (TPR) repeat protein
MQTRETNRVGSDNRGGDALIHREILQIAALILIAVLGFFLTRAVAQNNRQATRRDGAAWYERGQRLISAGRIDEAIVSFRRASARNRDERTYALALAKALERNGDIDAARATLLMLREASPEDITLNLALARLAARRKDVAGALRFYHNALYAPWPAASARDRREVRFELIDFLFRLDQTGRALSELLAVAADLPDDAATHVRVGQLFARAGDAQHALDQFQRALRIAPTDATALAGAGVSAFTLGDYLKARFYLRHAPDVDDVARTREIVLVVLSSDPLASRIGSAERRRRLSESLDYVAQRLQRCEAKGGRSAEVNVTRTLDQETDRLREQVRSSAALEQDVLEAGVDLLGRVEQHLAKTCPPLSARDQALALIARRDATASR